MQGAWPWDWIIAGPENSALIHVRTVQIGRERDLVLSLSRKAAALAASDTAPPLRIISAFHRDSIKGYIYIEAKSEDYVDRKSVV